MDRGKPIEGGDLLKILVLGSTGLLGSTLVPSFREMGHEVRGLERRTGGIVRDLLDPDVLETTLDEAPLDAVVNLVALADVDACQRDPEAAHRLNALLPGRIARSCRDRGIRFVHVSTDMVYDGQGPHAEDSPRARNVYASTKLRGEELAAESGGTSLRTNFFGGSRHASRRSFSDWLLAGFRENRELTLLRDVWFSPLSMGTLAERLAGSLPHLPSGEVFNLGSREGMTKRDFALALAEAHGLREVSERSVTLDELGLAAARPRDMRMDVAKFESLQGIPLPTLASEIRRVAKEPR